MKNKKIIKAVWNDGKGYNPFSDNNAITGEEVLLITGETNCYWKLEDGSKVKKANAKFFTEETNLKTKEELHIEKLTQQYNKLKNKQDKKRKNLRFNEYTQHERQTIFEAIDDLQVRMNDIFTTINECEKLVKKNKEVKNG